MYTSVLYVLRYCLLMQWKPPAACRLAWRERGAGSREGKEGRRGCEEEDEEAEGGIVGG